jgi:hypothetical protein
MNLFSLDRHSFAQLDPCGMFWHEESRDFHSRGGIGGGDHSDSGVRADIEPVKGLGLQLEASNDAHSRCGWHRSGG